MTTPKLSFVVLADRPLQLRIFLAALAVQTSQDFEIRIINQAEPGCDYATINHLANAHVVDFAGRIHVYPRERAGDWGQTAKFEIVQQAKGDFVCVPNDDAYYVPQFVERMLHAASTLGADLVYCDWLFDKYGYVVYRAQPVVGYIDVGGFIVRRDVLVSHGWPDRSDTGDGRLIESLVRDGVKHARVPNVLYVKN